MKIRLHYNKLNAKSGRPWTLHTSKGCFSASHVKIYTTIETEERPLNRHNPRYFLVTNAEITWQGDVAILRKKI